jgi:hypothetical protein
LEQFHIELNHSFDINEDSEIQNRFPLKIVRGELIQLDEDDETKVNPIKIRLERVLLADDKR